MGDLPVVSGRDVVKAMAALGYRLDRHKGSHMILRQQDAPHRRLVVPDHREVGTLRSTIREAGLTVDTFRGLL